MTFEKQSGPWQRLIKKLMHPRVDRIIAIVAVLPFVYELYGLFRLGQMNIPRANVAVQFLLVVGTMAFRTAPMRVTANPIYWLLAFVASYWGLFVAAFAQRGVPIVPSIVSDSISILSMVIAIYARLSLGRSIGLVPAQRAIITGGAYRYVRHPIYTGLFISYLSFVLRVYTLRNLMLALCGIGYFIVKSFIEEGFLRQDPDYAGYLARVRWRWFPGIG